MGGKAPGRGMSYQSHVIALIYAHVLAGVSLNWMPRTFVGLDGRSETLTSTAANFTFGNLGATLSIGSVMKKPAAQRVTPILFTKSVYHGKS